MWRVVVYFRRQNKMIVKIGDIDFVWVVRNCELPGYYVGESACQNQKQHNDALKRTQLLHHL